MNKMSENITNINRVDREHGEIVCDGEGYVFDYEVSISFIINFFIRMGKNLTPGSIKFLEDCW